MKVGDKVRMAPMGKYDEATGVVKKFTADGYVVVRWEGIPGDWHYTEEQAKLRMEVIDEGR